MIYAASESGPPKGLSSGEKMPLIRPPSTVQPLDRAFALEAVRVTEAAAIAAAAQIGRGDEHAADQAAVEAMRAAGGGRPGGGAGGGGGGGRGEAPGRGI